MVRLSSAPNIVIDDELKSVIIRAAEKTLEIEGSDNYEVSIHIIGDDEIRELNKLYRGVDSETDVLAFSLKEGADAELSGNLLGDVVISITTAESQAQKYGHSLEAELSLLTIHGVLHLLGYDHEDNDEAYQMRKKQKEILSELCYNINDETY